MAEGVVFAPFLPSGDQDCKGGFAIYHNSPQTVAELLAKYRLKSNLSSDVLAAKLGVSLGAFKNWEHGRTEPSKKFWPALKLLEKCPRGNPTFSFSA